MNRRLRLGGISRFYCRSPGALRARVFAATIGLMAGCTSLSAVEMLEAIVGPNSSIFLRWEDATDVENGYRIERRIGESDPVVFTASPDTVHFTDLDVSPKTEYSYRVVAVVPDGANLEATVSITTPSSWEGPMAKYRRRCALLRRGAPGPMPTARAHNTCCFCPSWLLPQMFFCLRLGQEMLQL